MSPYWAPKARRSPILLRLSVTEMSMTFITPIPPIDQLLRRYDFHVHSRALFVEVALDLRFDLGKGDLGGEPLRQIAANAGFEGSIVVKKVKDGKGAYRFDAATAQYGDMFQVGMIDPTKVSRFALQNAASVASLMLTTEAMVAGKPKKKTPPGLAMPPDMGDYD